MEKIKFEDVYNNVFKKFPDVLSVNQLCEVLHLSKPSVYKLLESGELKSLRVGAKYKIPKVYVMEYMQLV
ncbi:MAG: helix-turn-helix domain-containing protein [Clostridia bacterium]|nr:helix-turn-helix domain-containing protein [Clostridia bacterium]